MSQNKVTNPVLALQKFTHKQKYSLPEFKLVQDQNGTLGGKFQYKVAVGDICAVGFGYSKKEAKHDAARNALTQLTKSELFNSDSNQVEENGENSKQLDNFIGKLNELCDKFQRPRPTFNDVSVMGIHCRTFTYECNLSPMTTSGTSSTKKQAKQLAARDMLSFFNSDLDKEAEVTVLNELSDTDWKARDKYNKLANTSNVNPKYETFDICRTFVRLMAEKHVCYEDFEEPFRKRDQAGLNHICAVLGIDYTIDMLQERPPIAYVRFGEGPFTLMSVGTSKESAIMNLISEIYVTLDVYMGMCDLDDDL